MTSSAIVVAAGACAVLAGSLAILAGDGAFPTADGLRTTLMNSGYSSDGTLEFIAQTESESSNPVRLAQAVQVYRTLLYRDPANPYRWCDLAEAWQLTGNMEQARAAFARATALAPAIPPVQARAGNFYFVTGDADAAIASYRVVLSLVHDYDWIVFLNLKRLGLSTRETTTRALPADRETASNYLRFVFSSGSLGDADLVWSWISGSKLADDSTAALLVDYLLSKSAAPHAAEIWANYVGSRRGDFLRPNLVYNGDFSQTLAPCRLDWRIQTMDGVEARIETPGAATRNLHIQFNGLANVDYHHVSQVVCLSPGRYRFRARIRSDGLTTNSGVQFHIADPTGRLQWSTDAILGSHPWMWIEEELSVPPSQFQTIEIVRRPSEKFDSKIEGSIWIDNVSIERAARLHRSPTAKVGR